MPKLLAFGLTERWSVEPYGTVTEASYTHTIRPFLARGTCAERIPKETPPRSSERGDSLDLAQIRATGVPFATAHRHMLFGALAFNARCTASHSREFDGLGIPNGGKAMARARCKLTCGCRHDACFDSLALSTRF
jgi:hypothetical protein